MIRIIEVIEMIANFPIHDEAYAILKGENGRYAFVWGNRYPFTDDLPTEDIPNGESGISWHDTEEEARKEMKITIDAVDIFNSRNKCSCC